MKGEIAKYSYVIMIAFIISSAFNYFYQIAMGILLSKADFGILGVALSIFYIASVLTQSTFSWSGTRRMAAYDDINEISLAFKTTITGNFLLAVIALTAILIVSKSSETYFIPNLIVSTALIATAIANSYNALLRATKKFVQLAIVNISTTSLKLFFSVAFVLFGFGAIGGLLGLLISIFFGILLMVHFASKIKLPKVRGFAFDMLIETFFVSIVFLGITFIINSSIIFMRWIGGNDILAGYYNASLTIARLPFFVTGALVTVLFPYVSQKNSEREEYAFQSIKYTALLIIPICISMAVDPKDWLNLFFGSKYMGLSTEILRILAIGMGMMSLTFITVSNLVAFERIKFPAFVLIVASLVLLVIALRGGAINAALSVLISSFAASVTLLIFYSRNYHFKFSLSYLVKITAAYAFLAALTWPFEFHSRLLSLTKITVTLALYLTLLSVFRLFDVKDVETLFSPLPKSLVDLILQLVRVLNRV